MKCSEQHAGDSPERPVLVNYTSEIIRHVVIAGLYDDDVKREVFGLPSAEEIGLNELVKFIEGKEVAREATTVSSSVNVLSQFKEQRKMTASMSTSVPE